MNEQNKKQIIIAVVLCVALVGVLVYQFGFAGKTAAPVNPKNAASGNKGKASTGAQVFLEKMEDINLEELLRSVDVQPVEYAKVRIQRNPMTPLVGQITPMKGYLGGEITEGMAAGAPTPDFSGGQPVATNLSRILSSLSEKQVTAIVYDPKNESKSIAVIDDEVVGVGYIYPNGVEVSAIEADRVILKVGDTLVPLEMKEM
ncbi:MAG TPA: hypothetical protein PK379_09590 [Candidatus Hydrogenedentes bacterium]|nr:hypothetical protein [Candidatus Hydrogenedentota bacterium]HOK90267.1 hypothetical protein [Candidatus Hydrogenedentota bacterium]